MKCDLNIAHSRTILLQFQESKGDRKRGGATRDYQYQNQGVPNAWWECQGLGSALQMIIEALRVLTFYRGIWTKKNTTLTRNRRKLSHICEGLSLALWLPPSLSFSSMLRFIVISHNSFNGYYILCGSGRIFNFSFPCRCDGDIRIIQNSKSTLERKLAIFCDLFLSNVTVSRNSINTPISAKTLLSVLRASEAHVKSGPASTLSGKHGLSRSWWMRAILTSQTWS